MAPPTNQDLNAKREKQCISITPERKYYRCANTWIKRSLRPTEWQKQSGFLYVPVFNLERVLNEGACLKFLAERTDIPLPKLYACFEDDGAAYLITEYVDGVGMNELTAEDQRIVTQELEKHINTLKALTSNVWGGPDGVVLPPYRIMRKSNGRPWLVRPRETHDLVFCHNDLSANNVIVDPATLKIKAIVDWEYGGFFPPEFEKPFYLRAGPSVALPGEIDDADVLTNMMNEEKLIGIPDHFSTMASGLSDVEKITATLHAYGAALKRRNVEEAVALYTEDGVILAPHFTASVGSQALRESYTRIFASVQLSISFDIAEIVVQSSEWAFARTTAEGTKTMLSTQESEPHANQELFIMKMEEGTWKIARYAFSSMKPLVQNGIRRS